MNKLIITDLLQIFKSSVSAVLPENLIRKTIKYSPGNQHLTVFNENFDVENKNIYLVGTGKAVQSMTEEVENILSSKIKRGIISVPEDSLSSKTKNNNVFYYEGAKNNLPDVNAEMTSRKVEELVLNLGESDLLIVLISGGGSALLTLPKKPVTLEEKTDLIKSLANSGADIRELNTVRKRLSDIKGGQLAIKAQPAKVISLILSDIVGDPIDLIASGPTVENEDNPSKARIIIEKYKLFKALPKSLKESLNETCIPTPFPRNNVKNYIIGSNKLSTAAAVKEAKSLNYLPIALSNAVTGNVKDVAREYTKMTKLLCNFINGQLDKSDLYSQMCALNIPEINFNIDADVLKDKDLCIILGGETTVEVKGKGKGGRNQQIALEFSNYLEDLKDEVKDFEIYLLSGGTDGIDGPTDAAGAIGYRDLISDAVKQNINVNDYLENNDSYNFYKQFMNGNLHVITGHTRTNVMDIHLLIIRKLK